VEPAAAADAAATDVIDEGRFAGFFRVAGGRIPEVRAFPLKIDFFYKMSALFICV
jgi:hypothetical protein